MINAKSALRWVLLLIVFGSVAVYAWQQSHKPEQQAAPESELLDSKVATVVVTYFTTDVRCDSCRTIEKLSRQAIEEGFPDEVASGTVLFRVLNTDRTENQHFVEDYEIANKTVIVSHQQDGKETQWLNRPDVWLLLEEPAEFLTYVREPVRRFLGKS